MPFATHQLLPSHSNAHVTSSDRRPPAVTRHASPSQCFTHGSGTARFCHPRTDANRELPRCYPGNNDGGFSAKRLDQEQGHEARTASRRCVANRIWISKQGAKLQDWSDSSIFRVLIFIFGIFRQVTVTLQIPRGWARARDSRGSLGTTRCTRAGQQTR